MSDNSDKAYIYIYGSHSLLKGLYPIQEIRRATSYPVQGFQFSKAFRKGMWDGRKHLFKKTGAFPTGLINTVKSVLEYNNIPYEVIDYREEPVPTKSGFDLNGISFDYPFDYQLEACKTIVHRKQGIVKAATNAGKTEIAAAVTQYLGLTTLFVVSTRELMYQAQKRFMHRLGITEKEVGVVGDGEWNPGTFVTVAMLPTLESRLKHDYCQNLLKNTKVLFIDECHHSGSESWFSVVTLCPAYYRIGLSGTPLDRSDGADLRLIAAVGEVIVTIDNKFLVDRGISARANIVWDKITSPILKKNTAYPTAYKQGVSENPELLEKIIEWTKILHKKGLGVLILCEEINHGKLIDEALWTAVDDQFIPHQFIHGSEDTETRQQALDSFGDRSLPVLISSSILDEGIDVPSIDALILAGSRKSKIRTMQRLGRGLRGDKLIVIEFANFCHKYLLQHSHQRMQDYKSEECFPIYNSAPDSAIIDKIWNGDD